MMSSSSSRGAAKVLVLDASNIESIACLGAHFFYAEQPEISIRYYRR